MYQAVPLSQQIVPLSQQIFLQILVQKTILCNDCPSTKGKNVLACFIFRLCVHARRFGPNQMTFKSHLIHTAGLWFLRTQA